MIISAGAVSDKKSLIYMRELFEKFALNKERRNKIIPLLKERLPKLGMSDSKISFVVHQEYKTLSFQQKINTLLDLPSSALPSLGKESVEELVKKLIDDSNIETSGQVIRKFLSSLNSDTENKDFILDIIGSFISLSSDSSRVDPFMGETIHSLSQEISKLKTDPHTYNTLLKSTDKAIKWCYQSGLEDLTKERWAVHNRFMYLYKLIDSLYRASEAKGDVPEIGRASCRERV